MSRPKAGTALRTEKIIVKRKPKITLGEALRHVNHDFAGHCQTCNHRRVIRREEIVALELPASMRVDELEARYRCAKCGNKTISFQLSIRNAPYTPDYNRG